MLTHTFPRGCLRGVDPLGRVETLSRTLTLKTAIAMEIMDHGMSGEGVMLIFPVITKKTDIAAGATGVRMTTAMMNTGGTMTSTGVIVALEGSTITIILGDLTTNLRV